MPRPTLFDSNAFLFQDGQPRTLTLILAIETVRGRLVGKVGFEIEGSTAISTSRSPYGLFWWETVQVKKVLLRALGTSLFESGIERLNWRGAPRCYGRDADWQAGGEIEDCNFHLEIDSETSFEQSLPADQARALARSRAAIASIGIETSHDWDTLFGVYKASREAKGFEQSMSLVGLQSAQSNLHEAYKVIVCREEEGLIGGWALMVVVSKEIIYLFITANNPERSGGYSPTIALINFAYAYAQGEGARILDLGTASLGGEVNEGVFAFKKSLGAILGCKKTHFITLNTANADAFGN